MLFQSFSNTIKRIQYSFNSGTDKMLLFVLYVQSKIHSPGIWIPYWRSFTLQVRKKYQSFGTRGNLGCIINQILHAVFQVERFFKITKLFCIPLKHGACIVGGSSRNIITFSKQVVKNSLFFILQNFFANHSDSATFFKRNSGFSIAPDTGP